MTMINIPCMHNSELKELFDGIGHPGRFVGGCVRDTLFGLSPKDIDIATSAKPNEVLSAAESLGYKVIPTGISHGTVTVMIEDEPYEITTLRKDVETDGRHAKIEFITDFEIDASRRDFTINAMSVDFDGNLYDYFGGVEDLAKRDINFVGEADNRIKEDFLRILRYFRFNSNYGNGDIDKYRSVLLENSSGLQTISGERIWGEVSKILLSKNCIGSLTQMSNTDVLKAIEFDPINLDYVSESQYGLPSASRLGFLSKTIDSAVQTCEKWKLSTAETKQAIRAVSARLLLASDDRKHKTADFWTSQIIDGLPRVEAEKILMSCGFGDIISFIPTPLPVFPVQGRDLIEKGMRPGKEIGEVLSDLKKDWVSSSFKMTKADLLDFPVKEEDGRPAPIF